MKGRRIYKEKNTTLVNKKGRARRMVLTDEEKGSTNEIYRNLKRGKVYERRTGKNKKSNK